jgi:hypothetical protein
MWIHFLSANAGQLSEAHQHVGSNCGVGIVGLEQKHTKHRERIGLD